MRLAAIATIAALALSPLAAQATTITFDDIGVPGKYVGNGFIDQGYNFGSGASVIDISSTSAWASYGPAYSGNYAALSNYGTVITMTKVGGGTFSLQDFLTKEWFTGFAFNVSVTGYLAGSAVGTLVFSDTNTWQDIAANFSQVDDVTFSGFSYFALDNVTVDAPSAVPEPGTLSLLGAALLCMAGFLRRRGTAVASRATLA